MILAVALYGADGFHRHCHLAAGDRPRYRRFGPITLKLALTSYIVSLAIFIPLSGWMADRFGAKQVFRAAILVFIVGSIVCASCRSLLAFVLARFLQGMGGAMMTPVARLVLVRATPSDLVSAMALLTIPALVGPLVGPPLGGFITTYFSWHWIFLINVPIGIIGYMLSGTSCRRSSPPVRRRSTSGVFPVRHCRIGHDLRPVGDQSAGAAADVRRCHLDRWRGLRLPLPAPCAT